MKLDNYFEDREIETAEDFEAEDFAIDAANMGMAIQAFYQYSQPIPSIVREVASNCIDSHKEASMVATLPDDVLIEGKGYKPEDIGYLRETFADWQDRDIQIEMVPEQKMTGQQACIRFYDYGIGLAPNRVRSIYTKFFSSTKRHSNDEHGAFGLGAKSPLGYTDLFNVTTVWKGVKYYYVIHNAGKAPRLELLTVEDTEEPNGTVVEVPIKNFRDYEAFQKAIRQQLAYFDGIQYENCNVSGATNPIYQGRHFVYKQDAGFQNAHICLGKVYYPIDFGAIGEYSHQNTCPIGLRFDIGELDIVWNREAINYTPATVDKIKAKLKLMELELQALHDQTYEDITDVGAFLTARENVRSSSFEIAPGVRIDNANVYIKMEAIYPPYKDLKKIPRDVFFRFKTHRLVEDGNLSQTKKLPTVTDLFKTKNAGVMFLAKGAYQTKKNQFISDTIRTNFYIIKDLRDMVTEREVKSMFGATYGEHDIEDEEYKLVTAFLEEAEDYFLDNFVTIYDDIEVTPEWEEQKKEERKILRAIRKKRRRYEKGETIPARVVRPSDEWRKDVAFERDYFSLETLDKFTGLTVYGFQADEDNLLLAAEILYSTPAFIDPKNDNLFNNKAVQILSIAMTNEKHVTDTVQPGIHVDTFLNSKLPLLIRHLTARRLKQLTGKGFDNLTHPSMDEIAPRIRKYATFVKKYRDTYYRERSIYVDRFTFRRQSAMEDTLEEPLIEVFERINGFDKDAINIFNEVRAFMKKYPLLESINFDTADPNEIRAYMESKGDIHPMLLHRYLKARRN